MKPVLALSYLIIGAASIPVGSFAATDAAQSQGSAQATARQESPIASKIKAELAARKVRGAADISVDVDSAGVVLLTGSAASQADVDKVVAIAQSTAGVTAVNNSVVVKPN
jgi:hyperosmotically inducible periplasmic protein